MNKYFNTDIESHYKMAVCPHCEKQNGPECTFCMETIERDQLQISKCANFITLSPKGKEVQNA